MGAHLPLLVLEPVGGEPLMSDVWLVRRQTYGYPVPKITQNSYCTLLWRARGARAYNGCLGQSHQRGPGAESLKAENLLKYWTSNKMGELSPFSLFFSVLQTAYYQ